MENQHRHTQIRMWVWVCVVWVLIAWKCNRKWSRRVIISEFWTDKKQVNPAKPLYNGAILLPRLTKRIILTAAHISLTPLHIDIIHLRTQKQRQNDTRCFGSSVESSSQEHHHIMHPMHPENHAIARSTSTTINPSRSRGSRMRLLPAWLLLILVASSGLPAVRGMAWNASAASKLQAKWLIHIPIFPLTLCRPVPIAAHHRASHGSGRQEEWARHT